MTRFSKICVCLLFVAIATQLTAVPRSRDPKEPGDIRDRFVRLIKKIPLPKLPKIFDDTVVPPKPCEAPCP